MLLRWIINIVEKIEYFRYRRRVRNLIARGLVIGKNVTIQPSVSIDDGYPYLIRIGNNCSLSNDVRVLAHDATLFKFTDGYTRLGKVVIKDNCFIGERTIILPGVTIGPDVLVAAGSVVNRDIPPNSCAAGVPARVYAKFDALVERHAAQIQDSEIYEYSDLHPTPNESLQEKIWSSVQNGDTYVKGFIRHIHTWNK